MQVKIILFLFLLSEYGIGQDDLRFKLLEKGTGSQIAFASIKVLNGAYGTFSDETGKFALPAKFKMDTILISCIGYQTKIFLPDGFKDSLIYLQTHIIELPSITVGKRFSLGDTLVGISELREDLQWGPSGFGEEFAQRISLGLSDGQYCKIKKLTIVAKYFNPSTPVLLHIFEEDPITLLPGKELLKGKFFIAKKFFSGKRIVVNFEKEDILLFEKNVFVGLQWLGTVGSKVQSASKSTVLPMTFSVSKNLTFSRNNITQGYTWNPLILIPAGENFAKTANTMFSITIEKYRL